MPLLTPERKLQYLANSSGTPKNRKPNIALTIHHKEYGEIVTCGYHTGTDSRRETIAAIASHIASLNAHSGTTGFAGYSVHEGDPAIAGVEALPAPGLDVVMEILELIEGPNPPQ